MWENLLNSPETQTQLLSLTAWNALKAGVILLLALVVITVARRTAAAHQHMILSLAMITIIALPVLSLVFPSWYSGLIGQLAPEWTSAASSRT